MSLLDLLDRPGPGAAWIKLHLNFPHHDFCLIWPFSRIQSGYACFGAENIAVHRFMCEYRNGPQPEDKPHAAHSCGRGHEGCVNPWHLDWKSVSENQADRYQHSGLQPRWKLTPAQVDEIRALQGRARVIDIARQFGISDTNVRNIHAGRLWKQDRTDYRQCTHEEIRKIRSSPEGVVGVVKSLAEEFGVSTSTIYRIKTHESYAHVDSEALVVSSTDKSGAA